MKDKPELKKRSDQLGPEKVRCVKPPDPAKRIAKPAN